MEGRTLEQHVEYLYELASRDTDLDVKASRIRMAEYLYIRYVDSLYQSAKVEIIMGDKVEGGKYDISGQAGAIGPNSKAEGNVFTQAQAQKSDHLDLQTLAVELSTLISTLSNRASRPDSMIAVGKIAEAQVAAKKGDQAAVSEALSKAGPIALSTAKELGVETATKAISHSMLKIATEQERARITPWAQLGHKKYLVKTESIDGLLPDRIWENLEQYGICLIRLVAYPPEETVLENIVKLIGFPAEEQNDYSGPIKDINPAAEGRANSGDTTSELGFHVDGTQDPHQPALLAFQYVRGAKLGANSRFADAAGILADFDESERNEILTTLARSDAAKFSKLGIDYYGPIFSYSPTGALMCRIRFDSVITVHDECRKAFDLLKERFESSQYPSMYLPESGDVVVFDNWRIMHARDEIEGPIQRHHRRVWIALPRHEHQIANQLGIRPVPIDIAAKIQEASARK
ncbi:MAG TPA: TauD/TfdA family dioxygenase [Nitrososphaera sp.]|nr:TauD/TfdA family dioxygenase [Nitrososphaera sp.]